MARSFLAIARHNKPPKRTQRDFSRKHNVLYHIIVRVITRDIVETVFNYFTPRAP